MSIIVETEGRATRVGSRAKELTCSGMSKITTIVVLMIWLVGILGILYIFSNITPNQEFITEDDAKARAFRRDCEVTQVEYIDGQYHMVCVEE